VNLCPSPTSIDIGLSDTRPSLELGRGVLAEGRVTTPPIVEHLDVLDDVLFCFVPSCVEPMVHELALECPENALDTGIVPAVACAAHAGGDAVLAEQSDVAPVVWTACSIP
jgi:hypothetical protein